MKKDSRKNRINEFIKAPKVRLIDEHGTMIGVVDIDEALKMANSAGLDLVEMPRKFRSVDSDGEDNNTEIEPPVCKILNYSKHRYDNQKKVSDSRKKQRTVSLKEVKFRKNIGKHDYDNKLSQIKMFLSKGDKVKVSLRFIGREVAHQKSGDELLDRIVQDVIEIAKVESRSERIENQHLLMLLVGKVTT